MVRLTNAMTPRPSAPGFGERGVAATTCRALPLPAHGAGTVARRDARLGQFDIGRAAVFLQRFNEFSTNLSRGAVVALIKMTFNAGKLHHTPELHAR